MTARRFLDLADIEGDRRGGGEQPGDRAPELVQQQRQQPRGRPARHLVGAAARQTARRLGRREAGGGVGLQGRHHPLGREGVGLLDRCCRLDRHLRPGIRVPPPRWTRGRGVPTIAPWR